MKFVITPALKESILASSLDVDSKTKLISQEFISHKNLIRFYKLARPTESLMELLQMSKLHIPAIREKPKPKTKEFIEYMEKLRLKAKEDEYQRLVESTPEFNTLYPQTLDSKISVAQAHKELKNQLTTILNIFISVASVSYAVWYWSDTSMNIQLSYRVLLSLFFGILVLVAEVVVYMGYLNRIEEARLKEQKIKEVKKVVRSIA